MTSHYYELECHGSYELSYTFGIYNYTIKGCKWQLCWDT